MKKIFFLLFLLGSTCLSFSQTLHKIEKDGLFGYVNNSGRDVIKCEYSHAYTDTIKNLGFVFNAKKKKIVCFDNQGKELFDVFSVDNGPDDISDGLFRIISKAKVGFANANGEIVISPQYFAVSSFKNGIAKITYKGKIQKEGEYTRIIKGKWGLINTKGEIIIPCCYDEIVFCEDDSLNLINEGRVVNIRIMQ